MQINIVTLDISGRNLKKLIIILPYHPDIPFFDICPKDLTSYSMSCSLQKQDLNSHSIITHANMDVGKSISTATEKQQVINECREMEN